jgi:hypothetical protein
MPHEDKAAPIECRLVEYSLQDADNETHPYEALSYVWGDPKDPVPIKVGQDDLTVTRNLHAALLHLRYRYFERILWVDAICIDQENLRERGEQVQSMAKIYGSANRVVVWLGEATADSDQALEVIRLAAEDETNSSNHLITEPEEGLFMFRSNTDISLAADDDHVSIPSWRSSSPCSETQAVEYKSTQTQAAENGTAHSVKIGQRQVAGTQSTHSMRSEVNKTAIANLLERPWFQRIWVLQEVAAARLIVIKCGNSEMNGYTFYSGLNSMSVSYEEHLDLESPMTPIHSVIRLIGRAIFRPKFVTSSSGNVSLNIGPLAELMDTYFAHKATDRRDKVYALLSMSSDDPSTANISPDYEVSWQELVQRLFRYRLSKEPTVDSWGNGEMAVFKSKGCVLGHVSWVDKPDTRYNRQRVRIDFNKTVEALEYEKKWGKIWTFHIPADLIQQGDVVCLLQGASRPTMIRTREDHSSVIMISLSCGQEIPRDSLSRRYTSSYNSSPFLGNCPNDFLLVWDWGKSVEHLQESAGQTMAVRINDLVPGYLKTASDKAAWMHKTALIVRDSKQKDKAEKRLEEVIDVSKETLGEDDPQTVSSMDDLVQLYVRRGQQNMAIRLLWELILTRKRVLGMDHPDTLTTASNLVSYCIGRDPYWAHDGLVRAIKSNNSMIPEELVLEAVQSNCDMHISELLLDLMKTKVQITEHIVVSAAANPYQGAQLMTLLLDRRNDDVMITEEVMKSAAQNPVCAEEIMTILLDRKEKEVVITEAVVKAAAENTGCGEHILSLLLDRRGEDVVISEAILKAAAKNPGCGKELMVFLLERRGDDVVITEAVVEAIADNLNWANDIMKYLLNQEGIKLPVLEELVVLIAELFTEEVMEELLQQRGNDIVIGKDVVMAAASNTLHGKEIMKVLLLQKADSIQKMEEVVAAVWQHFDKEVAALLPDLGDEEALWNKNGRRTRSFPLSGGTG